MIQKQLESSHLAPAVMWIGKHTPVIGHEGPSDLPPRPDADPGGVPFRPPRRRRLGARHAGAWWSLQRPVSPTKAQIRMIRPPMIATVAHPDWAAVSRLDLPSRNRSRPHDRDGGGG